MKYLPTVIPMKCKVKTPIKWTVNTQIKCKANDHQWLIFIQSKRHQALFISLWKPSISTIITTNFNTLMNLKLSIFIKLTLWPTFNKNIYVRFLNFVFQTESDFLKRLLAVVSKHLPSFLRLIKVKDISFIVLNTGKKWLNLLKNIFLNNFTNFILFRKIKCTRTEKSSMKRCFVLFLKFRILIFFIRFYKIFIVLFFLFLLLKKEHNTFQISKDQLIKENFNFLQLIW